MSLTKNLKKNINKLSSLIEIGKKFMRKILLCGNGLNINFDKKFKLSEFIDLLLDENKLRNFTMYLPEFERNSFDYDTNSELNQFIFIIKKYKNDIEKAKIKLINNGVELIFLEIFDFIEEYMA